MLVAKKTRLDQGGARRLESVPGRETAVRCIGPIPGELGQGHLIHNVGAATLAGNTATSYAEARPPIS